MTSITYPDSRAHSTICKLCMAMNGQMRDDGYVSVETEEGRKHRRMKRIAIIADTQFSLSQKRQGK